MSSTFLPRGRKRPQALLLPLLALFWASSLFADVTLSGTVRDLSGTAQYSSLVVYRSDNKRVAATGNTSLVTGSAGKYSFSLPPGTYDIYVRAFGFMPSEVTNVAVQGDVVRDLTIDQTAATTQPSYLKSATTSTPAVFIGDPASTTSIVLTSTQTLGPTFTLFNEFGQFTLDGIATGTIDLYDDGTHGDAKAGDFLYTRSGLGSTQSGGSRCNTMANASLLYARTGGKLVHLPSVQVIAVKPAAPPIAITTLATGAQASTYAANVIVDLPNTSTAGWEKLAAKAFYQSFADVYDFLVLFPGTPMNGASGLTTVVRNDVTGIGRTISDDTAQFGSAGKLQATMAINFSADPPLLHEIMHRWANNVTPPFNATYLGHWGYSGVNGILGGFDPATLVKNSDNSYTVAEVAPLGWSVDFLSIKKYGALERYLAGFVPASSAPAVPVFSNVQTIGGDTRHFTGIRSDVGAAVLAAQFGARNPSVTNSQKAFRIAFVGVTRTPMNAAGMTYLSTLAQQFSAQSGCISSFPSMTDGVATMDATIVAHAPPKRRSAKK
jgi:hypothetical protein